MRAAPARSNIDAMQRRTLFSALALPAIAQAQSRPVRLIVPFIAGSAPDVLSRHMVEPLSAALGQPVVIENRPGAGGNIGSEAAARAPADGTVLMLGTNALVVNQALHTRPLPFDVFRDFAPISLMFSMPHLLITAPDGPRDIAALIAWLRQQSGAAYASGGNGSGAHLAAALFGARLGLQLEHIPFRGAPEIVSAVMAGQVRFGFPTLATATELVRGGRLRGLAVTSATRNHALPDVPPVADTIPGFDLVSWFALMAPAGVPQDFITRVDAAVRAALADPALRTRVMADGTVPMGWDTARLTTFLRDEATRWGEAVRISGARVD